jgi:hypothetical protein
MAIKHTSAKREPRESANGRWRETADGCFTDQRASKAKSGSVIVQRDAQSDSIADKKMLRAWETISTNRGAAKRKR